MGRAFLFQGNKLAVDPARHQAIVFEMLLRAIAKGALTRCFKSVSAVERDAGVTLPLPEGVDRDLAAGPWPADLRVWRRAQIVCAR